MRACVRACDLSNDVSCMTMNNCPGEMMTMVDHGHHGF